MYIYTAGPLRRIELTQIEIDAFKFIFDYLDHSAFGQEALENFEIKHLLMGKDNHRGMSYQTAAGGERGGKGKAATTPAKGFGKK